MIDYIVCCRFGNILFQYAAGRHLALKRHTPLRINLVAHLGVRDPRARRVFDNLQLLNLKATYARPWLLRVGKYFDREMGERGARAYREQGYGFDPQFLEQKEATRVMGLCQSPRYFRGIESLIREDLRIELPAGCPDIDSWDEMIQGDDSVAVHVRRGDYLTRPALRVCNLNYYRKALAFMRRNLESPRFFVFSDDHSWCEEHFSEPGVHLVRTRLSDRLPAIDMELMRRCRHQVIANSTFSWWAAWLNENPGKIVVAPYKWFNQEAMNQRAMEFLVPRDWIHLEF